jgi:hypothetical protein
MKIEHRDFSFSKPDFLTKEEYEQLKLEFLKKPNLELYNNVSFWDYFGVELKYKVGLPLAIGILFTIFYSFTQYEIFEWILGALTLYLMALIFLKLLWEYSSFIIGRFETKYYYRKLKRKIITSSNYEDFISTNRFWRNMHPNT